MDEITNNIDPIWTRIELLMKSRGLNQKEFAARMRVTPTTVTDWKTGKSKSYQRINIMLSIAKVLGMTVEGMFPEWNIPDEAPKTPGMELSSDEMALVECYRQLNQDGKTQIQNLSESMKRSGMYEPGVDYFMKGLNSEAY